MMAEDDRRIDEDHLLGGERIPSIQAVTLTRSSGITALRTA